MLIIDNKETISWLSKHGLIDDKGQLSFSGFLKPITYMIPGDSGGKTVISKTIMSFFDVQDEALLWIDEFGIWPSAEDWNLFEGYRKSLGEHSPLYEKPGHIFSSSDLESIGPLTSMVLYFVWGALIVSTAKNFIIRISHDEWLEVFAKDDKTLSEIQGSLDKILKA